MIGQIKARLSLRNLNTPISTAPIGWRNIIALMLIILFDPDQYFIVSEEAGMGRKIETYKYLESSLDITTKADKSDIIDR
jgi:hypothetical protein